MGQSTNAILCYGVTFEEGTCPWKERAEAVGFDNKEMFGEDCLFWLLSGELPPQVPYEGNEGVYDDYFDKKRNGLREVGISFLLHCSCDYPMYGVIATASEVVAYRGYPKTILPDQMHQASEGYRKTLEKYAETFGIDINQAGWILCSLWC